MVYAMAITTLKPVVSTGLDISTKCKCRILLYLCLPYVFSHRCIIYNVYSISKSHIRPFASHLIGSR